MRFISPVKPCLVKWLLKVIAGKELAKDTFLLIDHTTKGSLAWQIRRVC